MSKITAISQEILKTPIVPAGSPEENNTLPKSVKYRLIIINACILHFADFLPSS